MCIVSGQKLVFHIPAWLCDQAVQPAFYLICAVLFIDDTIAKEFTVQLILMA